MKILRVIARLNVGGPARHVVLLDTGLERRGHATGLVHGSVAADEASLENLAASARIRTLKLAELGPRVSLLSDVRVFLRLVGIVFRESPDVVHTHTAKAGALGRVSALLFNLTRGRRRRALVVHTFHGHVLDGYFSPTVNGLVRFVERSLARVTARIVTISPLQRVDIVSRYRIAPADKTVMIPLGLDLSALLAVAPSGAARRAWGVSEHGFVIGYVGRLVPIKDLATLVRAFALVVRQAPDATLMLAGDGPVRSELEALVASMGLAERVRFVGWTDALASLYAAMDVCALSSLNEGTPVALIEAMAAARAVVATRVGGVADVIDDGRTGLLVPARDVDALAQALVTLARDRELRARLGLAARQDVAARFSHERLVDEIERLYVDALFEVRGASERR